MPNHVYDETKRRILYLEYAPGQPLLIRDISTALNVSPTPVREALIRLECEGLVERAPNRGVHVAEVSLQEVKDIFETRFFLADIVAELAVQRATDEELAELENLLAAFVSESEEMKKLQIHEQFHRKLDASTKNKILIRILETLHDHQFRLMLSISRNSTQQSDVYMTIAAEFRALLQALHARDADRAKEALRQHTLDFIRRVQQSTTQVITERLSHFLDSSDVPDLEKLGLSETGVKAGSPESGGTLERAKGGDSKQSRCPL